MTEAAQEAEVIAIDPIRKAFDDAIAADLDEEATKHAMLNAGAKFSAVNKRYREYSIAVGLDLSRADRREMVSKILTGRQLNTADSLADAVKVITNDVLGMTEQKAFAAIKFWAKQNEVEVFTRPRGAGVRQNFTLRYHDFLVSTTPFPTKEQAQEFINEHGTKNSIKRISRHLAEYDMAARLVKKFNR